MFCVFCKCHEFGSLITGELLHTTQETYQNMFKQYSFRKYQTFKIENMETIGSIFVNSKFETLNFGNLKMKLWKYEHL